MMRESVDNPRGFHLGGEQRIARATCLISRKPCGGRPEWHILATQPNKQFLAENAIAEAGWTVFHPLHLQRTTRNPDRIVSLFPGYLFVSFHPDTDWSSLARMRYVWKILQAMPGKPAVVPDDIVRDLRLRMSSRRIVDDPLVTPPSYPAGTKLVVTRGPLTGLEGLCKLSGSGRVTLLFSLLGSDFQREMLPMDVLRAADG